MIETLNEISGDFSLRAISLRLLAPNAEKLFKFMPRMLEETNIKNWNSFRKNIDWHREALSIRYISNFVHEFVHLLQHTTLIQCITQVESYHNMSWIIFDNLKELKKQGYTPKVPLTKWLNNIDNETSKKNLKLLNLVRGSHLLYLGNEEFAKYHCSILQSSLEDIFIQPFNPRLNHLNKKTDDFDTIPITTNMLLESQATLITFRYIALYFGEKFANDFVLGAGSYRGTGLREGVRVNYDIIPIIAFKDNMSLLTSIIIDWSLEGSAYIKNKKTKKLDYSHYHPPWRFVKLYNATKLYLEKNHLNEHNCFLKGIIEFKNKVFKIAKMDVDTNSDLVDYVNNINNDILRPIFKNNICSKTSNPDSYYPVEINFDRILYNSYIPIMQFRDQPYLNFSKSISTDMNSSVNGARLSFFSRRSFELDRMMEGFIPKCPFCQGVDYISKDGIIKNKYPPVGTQSMIDEDISLSKNCNCSWIFEFKDYWDYLPKDIEIN